MTSVLKPKRGLFYLLVLIHTGVLAQFNEGRLITEHFYTEIPFEYVHDKIVIEASMNGVSGRYLLDTGAMCILFKDSTYHKLPAGYRMNIGDATGKKQEAEVIVMPSITVGELTYEAIPTLYVDMFEGPFKCLGYKGIIGSNLLRFGAFKIDWTKQKLIIADSFQTLRSDKLVESKLLVNKQQSSPFIKVKVNGKPIKWVLVDTGSGDSFVLNNNTAHWLKKKKVLTKPIYQSSGTNSHGAWGAGDYESEIFSQLTLKLGHINTENAVIETSAGQSKIGMKVLELGDFILDYPQKRFFFQFNEPSQLKLDSFGIDFIMDDDKFIVNGIWQGSPAAASGIEKGDILEDIEGADMKNKSSCDVFLSLKDVTQNKKTLTFHFIKPHDQSRNTVTLSRIEF